MRLIDADELLARIRLNYNNHQNITAGAMKDIIDTTPTAYDIEKVVAELACNSRFIDDINEHNIKCISCVIGQKTAIDIVKAGGWNEQGKT